ncbi:MAG: HIT domain-containing protein [Pelagibacteraceae bacterium]|nr:HIT domain-containing protein [Pelagibacteraceae bacterium]PHX89663.1 MAG: HIT family protein [Pelagibacteraceae bacterium]
MNKINKNFLKSSHYVGDLKLCKVRLIDNEKFPWIILIPKRKGVTDITNLNSKDQALLMKEIVHGSKIMKKVFKTTKLNVEKIGNIVPQLHIHIIARYQNDYTWPLSVWVKKGKNYPKDKLNLVLNKLQKVF